MVLLIVCNILFVVLYDRLRGHPTDEEQSPLVNSQHYLSNGGHTFDNARDLDGSIKELRM